MNQEKQHVSPELLLQKIGELVVVRDVEAAQYQQKIKQLEATIKELTEKRD